MRRNRWRVAGEQGHEASVQLADGTAFRVLIIVDLYTHECVGLVPAVRLRADDVVSALNRLRDERGVPAVIQGDMATVVAIAVPTAIAIAA